MTAKHDIGNPSELAADYAAGAMTRQQASEFEAHLAEGCAPCAEELSKLDPVMADLFQAVVPQPVPSRVRGALMARIAAGDKADFELGPQVWKQWRSDADDSDVVIRQAASGGWQDTGIEGIRIRRLCVDRQRDQMTALIRMAPNTSYPGHLHHGAEECYVLEGRLRAGDHFLDAGDYERMVPGSHHGVQSTEGGCLLLIISSLSDELE